MVGNCNDVPQEAKAMKWHRVSCQGVEPRSYAEAELPNQGP
jgi:hypothetical protein